MDTIFALASGAGKAGVSVIRVSGPQARESASLFGVSKLPDRGMSYRKLYDTSGEILDDGLILTFSGPESFTGEDIVEYQLHGSQAIVERVHGILSESGFCRPATAGEFTQRALINGKMDLTQVEALADLIDAETEVQRLQAQRVLSGALRDKTEVWRSQLIRAAALLAVTIDFADEEVPDDVSDEVKDLLSSLVGELRSESARVDVAERVRSGFEVAIVGEPNVGKSTILNALAGRDAALTSEHAGTTRDIVEVRMDVNGLPVTFLDTAGVHKTDNPVEVMGIERTLSRGAEADIRVFVSENPDDLGLRRGAGDLHFYPKADIRSDGYAAISGKRGDGIRELLQHVERVFVGRVSADGVASRFRHKRSLDAAAGSLENALEQLNRGVEFYDIVSEEIRFSLHSLDSLVGRVGVEDLLDEIFSSFCLGK